MKSLKGVCILSALLMLTACARFGQLRKEQAGVSLSLPDRQLAESPAKVQIARDSTMKRASDPGFVFVSATGDSVPVGLSTEWDSIHRENITKVAMDEVVISASSVRNTAERGGKINIEFVVTVPKELQAENRMVNVRPVLLRGDVPDSLKELRFTGAKFRESQEKDYRRYDRFLEGIIPDSVNFYHTFVNYRSFERYLQRLKWQERGLEKRAAVLAAKMRRPDPLLQRFQLFNDKALRKDSLLQERMREKADREIARQWWRYDRSREAMNDTLRYLNRHLLDRLRFFNSRGEVATERWEAQQEARRNDPRRPEAAVQKAEEMIERKNYFRERVQPQSTGQAGRSLLPVSDRELYYPRFIYFNDRMESRKARLYIRYRVKGARAESGEGIKLVKALMAGRDTSTVMGREKLTEKYTRKFDKIKDLLPMFHYRRPESDSLPPAWLVAANDTVRTRKWQLAQFSEKEIYDRYAERLTPAEKGQQDTAAIASARPEGMRRLLPVYTYRRELPDSVQVRTPGRRTVRNFERSKVDSAATQAYVNRRYGRLHDLFPQYRHTRELSNINPPHERYAAQKEKIQERIDRIASLDSASLVKMFYDTQKIARNEARKAIKDERFREMVRFPFNPEAQLDTVIYAADQVRFLYSEKVPADENSSRMKVFLVGDVVSSNGEKYTLPMSDTLTYLVSSMTKFVDKTPRYVRKIITRDAEANASVDFFFRKNRFKLDNTIDRNRKGLQSIHDITLALMTDPVYIIDSLTVFASSSPEGNWKINGEIARKRGESIREVLVNDFKQLYDSLAISATAELDETGNMVKHETKEEIPDLPRLIRLRTLPEDWNKLYRMIQEDDQFAGNKEGVLKIINEEANPDRRELLIKRRYRSEYAYMLDKLYPAMRSVDFRFSLSRRGMRQDTLYTQELDTAYMRGVEYLEKRKYTQALEILRSYNDFNTALAYMSLGYDKAALRILQQEQEQAETNYLQAILHGRLGDEQQAVLLLLRAAEMDGQMKFRANLDPELSLLVRKFGLFEEEEDFYEET